MKDWLTKTEIIFNFLFDYEEWTPCINLRELASILSRALVLDNRSITEYEIFEDVLLPVARRDGGHLVITSDFTFVQLPIMYLCYADWISNLAERLGHTGTDDDFVCLDWLRSYKYTKRVHDAMSWLGMQVAKAASDAYEQDNGHSMMDVLFMSFETGEDFDQCRARLSANTKGLQVV